MTQVIETDELGQLVLSSEVLQQIKPHTKYMVEAKAEGLVIYPQTPILLDQPAKLTSEQWEAQWREVQEQVSKSWPAGISAVDVISEMRG